MKDFIEIYEWRHVSPEMRDKGELVNVAVFLDCQCIFHISVPNLFKAHMIAAPYNLPTKVDMHYPTPNPAP